MSSESEGAVKKLVSVSATSMPVTETREKEVGTAEASKDGEESEGGYRNLTRVPCI